MFSSTKTIMLICFKAVSTFELFVFLHFYLQSVLLYLTLSLLKMESGSASGQDAALLGSLLSCTWEGHFALGSLGWWVRWPSWRSIIPLLIPPFLGQIPHLTKKFKLNPPSPQILCNGRCMLHSSIAEQICLTHLI